MVWTAIEPHVAAVGAGQPGEDARKRRLAGAVAADQRVDLPAPQIEAEVREHGNAVASCAVPVTCRSSSAGPRCDLPGHEVHGRGLIRRRRLALQDLQAPLRCRRPRAGRRAGRPSPRPAPCRAAAAWRRCCRSRRPAPSRSCPPPGPADTAPSAMLSLRAQDAPSGRHARSASPRPRCCAVVHLPLAALHASTTFMPGGRIASSKPSRRCWPLNAVGIPSMIATLSPGWSCRASAVADAARAGAVVGADERHFDAACFSTSASSLLSMLTTTIPRLLRTLAGRAPAPSSRPAR